MPVKSTNVAHLSPDYLLISDLEHCVQQAGAWRSDGYALGHIKSFLLYSDARPTY